MSASLVGSEMCIRDSCGGEGERQPDPQAPAPWLSARRTPGGAARVHRATVSYTHLTLPTICSV
eukprot:7335947-Alexandrium_andersonii.AAC.1